MANTDLPGQARAQMSPPRELAMLALISEQLNYLAELQEFLSPNKERGERKLFAERREQILGAH